VSRMDPIPIGRRKVDIGGISLRFLIRYALFSTTVCWALSVCLVPFMTRAEAASQAMCGGNTRFHWELDEVFTQTLVITDPSADENAQRDCTYVHPYSEFRQILSELPNFIVHPSFRSCKSCESREKYSCSHIQIGKILNIIIPYNTKVQFEHLLKF